MAPTNTNPTGPAPLIPATDDLAQSIEVLLNGNQPEGQDAAPDQLDAIRGQNIPIILQNGQGVPEILGQHQRVSFDAETATQASRMTVWDRGEALFSEAFPGENNIPDSDTINIKTPCGGTLIKRLLTTRCKSARPKDAWFFPRGSVEAIITEEEVAKVIAGGRRHLEVPLTDNAISDYARRVCREQLPDGTESSYRKMFAILVLMERGWEIVLFVDEGICDANLPLKAVDTGDDGLPPTMRLESDPDTDLACMRDWGLMAHENFERWQWAMLAPFFARGKRRQAWFYELSARDVLPWTSEQSSLYQGGYGCISKVEIHPSHHNFKVTNMTDGTFAVKHFKANMHASSSTTDTESNGDSRHVTTNVRKEFEREIEILRRFSGDVHPHLISVHSAFRHGDDYCLIFPWAECDLKTLWKTRSSGPPLRKSNLEWVLSQCKGIASGLQSIHLYQTTESMDSDFVDASTRFIYGRHGDIKPENILLFRDQKNPIHRGKLVITDFGLTRFHSDGTKTYFTNKDVAATLTYRPPECDMEGLGRTISRSFDIWSLGCVLIEFVAWYLGGWELIDKFVQQRKVSSPFLFGWNMDQFFEIVRPKGKTSGPVYSCVKHEVLEFVNEMRSHPDCSDPVHRLLDFIMEKMLVVESRGVHARANCTEVYLKLDNLYKTVVGPAYQLVANPRPRTKLPVGKPEAVEMPLNIRARQSAQPRFTQLREHTGSTRRLSHRFLDEPSREYLPRRTQTSPPNGG